MEKEAIYRLLEEEGIPFAVTEYPPVFTMQRPCLWWTTRGSRHYNKRIGKIERKSRWQSWIWWIS